MADKSFIIDLYHIDYIRLDPIRLYENRSKGNFRQIIGQERI